jgi:hypothetical protein
MLELDPAAISAKPAEATLWLFCAMHWAEPSMKTKLAAIDAGCIALMIGV